MGMVDEKRRVGYRNIVLLDQWRGSTKPSAPTPSGGGGDIHRFNEMEHKTEDELAGGGGSSGPDKFYYGNYDYAWTSLTPEEEESVLSGRGGYTPEGVKAAAEKQYLDEHPDIVRVTSIVNQGGKSYVLQQDFTRIFSWNCPEPGWKLMPTGETRVLGVYGVAAKEMEEMASAQLLGWKIREKAKEEGTSYGVAGFEEAGRLYEKYYGPVWSSYSKEKPAEAYKAQLTLGRMLSRLAWDPNAVFGYEGSVVGGFVEQGSEDKERYDKALLHAFHQYEAETEDALQKNDYALWLRNPAEYAMKKQGYTAPRGFLYGFKSAFLSNMTFGLSEGWAPRSRLPDYLMAAVGDRPAGYNPHNPMPEDVANRYLGFAMDYFNRHPGAAEEILGELAGDIASMLVGPYLLERTADILLPRIMPRLQPVLAAIPEHLSNAPSRLTATGARLAAEGAAALEASARSETFIGSGALTGRAKLLGGRLLQEGGMLLEFIGEKTSPLLGKLSKALEPSEWRVRRLEAVRLESGEPVGGTRLTPVVREEVLREKPPASSLVRLEDIVGYQGRGFLYDTETVSRLRYRLYSARRTLRGILGLGDDYFDVFEARQLYGGGPARLNVEAWGVPGQTDIGFTGVVGDEVWYRGAPSSKYRSPLYMEGKIGGSIETKVLAPEFDEARAAFRVRYRPGRPRYPKQALEKTIDAVLSEVWENPETPNISMRLDNLFNAWLKPSRYAEPTVYERFVGVKLPAKWIYPIDTGTETLRSVKTRTVLDRVRFKPGFGVTRTKIGYDVKEWTIDLGLWPRAAAERLAGAAAEAESALKGKRILGLYIDIDSVYTLPKETPTRKIPSKLPGSKAPGPPGPGGETPKVDVPSGPASTTLEPGTPGSTHKPPAPETPGPSDLLGGPPGPAGQGGGVGAASGLQASTGQLQVLDVGRGSAPTGVRLVTQPILSFRPVYHGAGAGAGLVLLSKVKTRLGESQGLFPGVKPTVKTPAGAMPRLFPVRQPKLGAAPRITATPKIRVGGPVKPETPPEQAQLLFTGLDVSISPVPPPPPPPILPDIPDSGGKKPKKGAPVDAEFRLRPIRMPGSGGSPYDVIKITKPKEFIKIF